jgi:hypothetical protein
VANKPIRWLLSSAVIALALNPFARAGDGPAARPASTAAPLQLPHTIDLLLNEQARKRARKADDIESRDLFELTPGLRPVTWPKNSDVRQRILTPEVKNTPVVGWIAENLYRSKNDNGWCLEVDPGEGEYIVFYRFHPKK